MLRHSLPSPSHRPELRSPSHCDHLRSARISRHSRRVLVDQIQHPHRPSVLCLRAYEVVTPYVVAVAPAAAARTIRRSNHSRLRGFCFCGTFSPSRRQDTLYPVFAHLPAVPLQQRRDAAIAVASILAGQLDDGPGECILVLALCQLVALRAAWLVHQPARPTLTQSLCS